MWSWIAGRQQYAVVVLVVTVGIAISIAAFFQVRSMEARRARNDFSQDARFRLRALNNSLAIHMEALRSIGSLFDAPEKVDREDFRTFVAHDLSRHPGIQALEWIPRIASSERAVYEALARRTGFPGFEIVERAADGNLVTAGRRDEYFPVYYLEPLRGNEAAAGFDLASNPLRLEALIQARDSGQIAATGRIKLVQEVEEQYGFLTFYPVYQYGSVNDTVAQRRANLTGFTSAVFRVKDIVEASLFWADDQSRRKPLDIQIYDTLAPPESRLLFPHSSALQTRQEDQGLQYRDTIEVGGRLWEVVLSSPSRLSVWATWQPWTALLVPLLLVGMVAFYLLAGLRRSLFVERLIDQRTRELFLSNQKLVAEIAVRQQAEQLIRQMNLELKDLNQTLERRVQQRTLELEEAQGLLVQKEKLAAIGQLAGGVAHDLRSPLGAISNAVYYLKRILKSSQAAQSNPRIEQFLEIINDEVQHSNRIITDLLRFARIRPPAQTPVNLAEIADTVLSNLHRVSGVRIHRRFDPELPQIVADGELLCQVFQNLANNALDAMPEGGELTVTGHQVDGFAELAFQDTGAGIDEANIDKLFDPLITTKIKSTGLGLSICWEIVSQHGGQISVVSKTGEGTTFTVRLPIDGVDSAKSQEVAQGAE